MGFLDKLRDRVRDFIRNYREARDRREFYRKKEEFKEAKEKEKQKVDDDSRIGDKFGGLVKDLIDNYDIDEKDAIVLARDKLATPEPDLSDDDLDLIRDIKTP